MTSSSIRREQAEVRKVVAECSEMVERCARRVQRELGLSPHVELGDLVQFGFVGLLEARERFDDTRCVEFRWFAQARVHGAILDGLRKMTRLPRRVHQQLRLAGLAHDEPAAFGDSLEAALAAGRLVANGGYLVLRSPYPTEPAREHASPEVLAHERRQAARVRRAVDELPEPDREITRRRIFEDEPLALIAADLGYSRPWTWRVLERACRAVLGALEPS